MIHATNQTLFGYACANYILDHVKNIAAQCDVALGIEIGEDISLRESPYFRGILSDAKRCGINAGIEETLVYPAGRISLNKSIDVSDAYNLDGGQFTPCTAEAVTELLNWHGIPIKGKDVCIIGKSIRVGAPIATELSKLGGFVTVCTRDNGDEICDIIASCDIVISCTGDQRLFTESSPVFRSGATVIDIGGEFEHGDDMECPNLVPYIGGVGPVTRAVLMRHAVQWYLPRINSMGK